MQQRNVSNYIYMYIHKKKKKLQNQVNDLPKFHFSATEYIRDRPNYYYIPHLKNPVIWLVQLSVVVFNHAR